MNVDKISRLMNIRKLFVLLYTRAGFGKTTSLLNLEWERVLYITTESGFRVLQGMLVLIEKLYDEAILTSKEETLAKFKSERPDMSDQLLETYNTALTHRLSKPKDYLLEIDHISVDCQQDLFSKTIWDAYNEKAMFHGIDMSKKDIIVVDTITYYSDIVVKERQIANANNNNKFATWAEHATAIKTLLDNLVVLRGIKVVIGHEGYDKDLKKRTLALQGDAVKTDISGRFNVVLYGTELKDEDTNKTTRVFITNPDIIQEKVDAKSQDPRLSEIEDMDLAKILYKLS